VQPVTVEEEEFQQALRQLAREVRLTGTPREPAEQTFQRLGRTRRCNGDLSQRRGVP
jgi:hypothetical protein